eukprot:tig00001657_g9539.t1
MDAGAAEVAAWLAREGLQRYADGFLKNRIGPDVLPLLSRGDLAQLGVTALGDVLRLERLLAALREAPDGGRGALGALGAPPLEIPCDVLRIVFSHMTPREVLSGPAWVCRQFREVAVEVALCGGVDMAGLAVDDARLLASSRSLPAPADGPASSRSLAPPSPRPSPLPSPPRLRPLPRRVGAGLAGAGGGAAGRGGRLSDGGICEAIELLGPTLEARLARPAGPLRPAELGRSGWTWAGRGGDGGPAARAAGAAPGLRWLSLAGAAGRCGSGTRGGRWSCRASSTSTSPASSAPPRPRAPPRAAALERGRRRRSRTRSCGRCTATRPRLPPPPRPPPRPDGPGPAGRAAQRTWSLRPAEAAASFPARARRVELEGFDLHGWTPQLDSSPLVAAWSGLRELRLGSLRRAGAGRGGVDVDAFLDVVVRGLRGLESLVLAHAFPTERGLAALQLLPRLTRLELLNFQPGRTTGDLGGDLEGLSRALAAFSHPGIRAFGYHGIFFDPAVQLLAAGPESEERLVGALPRLPALESLRLTVHNLEDQEQPVGTPDEAHDATGGTRLIAGMVAGKYPALRSLELSLHACTFLPTNLLALTQLEALSLRYCGRHPALARRRFEEELAEMRLAFRAPGRRFSALEVPVPPAPGGAEEDPCPFDY